LVSDYSIQSHSGESSECFSGDWQWKDISAIGLRFESHQKKREKSV
jgi:hypothetical protein